MGISDDASVMPQHLSLLIHKIAREGGSSDCPLNEGGIISVGDKADILTIMLVGIDQAVGLGQLANLGFLKTTQREKRMSQLLLGQHVEKIALILAAIQAALEQVPASGCVLFHPGIVAGGQVICSQDPDPVQQRTEFDGLVADRAGIGSTAILIFFNKITNDCAPKHLGNIKYVKGSAKTAGNQPCILRICQGAAGFAGGLP